ncbi:MAG: glycine cleavage system protein H [Terriglobales bacterium]|jgi:glycine cleavage system H lipoate-binding protein
MTVLLVLFFFATFLAIDYFRTRHAFDRPALQVAPAKHDAVAPRLQPALVGGFAVPENLRYHPGHTWALSESPNLVRVGMDDFASKLTGTIENITLPQRGQWIRQGQKMCTLYRDDYSVDMVSPIEGTVSEINQALMDDPKLALRDPYGEGWLVTVQSPDAKTSFKNLLGGPLARWWTEEAASRLQHRMPMPLAMGALAQDGGVAINDVATQIPGQEWLSLAKEFFLS